eukprot:1905760-Pyramimonas_sp.AAC.1
MALAYRASLDEHLLEIIISWGLLRPLRSLGVHRRCLRLRLRLALRAACLVAARRLHLVPRALAQRSTLRGCGRRGLALANLGLATLGRAPALVRRARLGERDRGRRDPPVTVQPREARVAVNLELVRRPLAVL